MKAMISQPMCGKPNVEIKTIRNYITNKLKESGFEVIDTLFDFGNKPAVFYLAKSIEAMSEVDVVVFTPDWEQARGCRIEFEIAKAYGKQIIILPNASKWK